METRTQPSNTGGRRQITAGRPLYNPILLLTILAFMAIVAIGFAGAAIALGFRGQTVTLIKVPDDYPTIQAAINAASPGAIIQVRAGTYNENLTLNKAVSLTAESFDQVNPTNNTTVIDGGSGGATILIPAGLTQMPTLRGFVIRNGNDGIQAYSEYIAEFNYFTASNILADYQMGSGGSNRYNVYFNSGNNAIHMDNLNRPLLIENNRILYAKADGIEIGLQDTSAPPSLIETDIRNNMLIGSSEDGIQFIDYTGNPADTNRRFVISRNLIANNKKAGIGLMPNGNTTEDYSGADTVEAIRVYNNTFYGNDYGISGGDNLVAFNNIIANSATRGVWKVQGPQGANSVIAYTLFFGNKLDTDQSTVGAGNIIGPDPLFVAAPNPGADGTWGTLDDDFSGLLLQSTSPAIDKGVTQYVASNGEPVPPDPITGFAGAAPDLGWREFGSPIFITPTPSAIPSPTLPVTSTSVSPTVPPSVTSTAASATPNPFTATSTPVTPTVPAATATMTAPPATATPSGPAPTSTSASTATSTTQVNVQSIAPTSAQANTSVSLTINGSGFADGAIISFEGGQGTSPSASAVQMVNSNTLTATVNVPANGSGTQTWSIRVTDPNGSSFVLPNAFTVNS
jgi:hypothetical protein